MDLPQAVRERVTLRRAIGFTPRPARGRPDDAEIEALLDHHQAEYRRSRARECLDQSANGAASGVEGTNQSWVSRTARGPRS